MRQFGKRLTAIILCLMILLTGVSAVADEYETLKKGNKGAEVEALQEALIAQGYLNGSATGTYNNDTVKAVKAFQKAEGLKASGTADCATLRLIYGDDELAVKLSGTYETDRMHIDGIFVDDSYYSKNKPENYVLLYLFYSVSTAGENFAFSHPTKVTVNGINSYEKTTTRGLCDYMSSYSYGSAASQVTFGTDTKVVDTFALPAEELAAGRTLTFDGDTGIGMDQIVLYTDDIIHRRNPKVIAKFIDPKGYEQAEDRFSLADSKTKKKIQKAIVGYYWDCYINKISFRIEFKSGGKYSLQSMGISTTGKFRILNGLVELTNDSTKQVDYLSYTWNDDTKDLDLNATDIFDFSIYQR